MDIFKNNIEVDPSGRVGGDLYVVHHLIYYFEFLNIMPFVTKLVVWCTQSLCTSYRLRVIIKRGAVTTNSHTLFIYHT